MRKNEIKENVDKKEARGQEDVPHRFHSVFKLDSAAVRKFFSYMKCGIGLYFLYRISL